MSSLQVFSTMRTVIDAFLIYEFNNSPSDGHFHIRLIFHRKIYHIIRIAFSSLTSFLGHITENREILYRMIVHRSVQDHSMKFEIQRFNNMENIGN